MIVILEFQGFYRLMIMAAANHAQCPNCGPVYLSEMMEEDGASVAPDETTFQTSVDSALCWLTTPPAPSLNLGPSVRTTFVGFGETD